jgi:hypothetical protein
MHLWFLLYLLYLYLLVPFCRVLVRWSLRHEARVGRFLASPWAFPVFALVTAATLWPYPGGQVFGDYVVLGFDPAGFAYYGTFFVIGYFCHHYRAATGRLVGDLPRSVALAVVLYPLSMYASQLEYLHKETEWGYHVAAILLRAFCTRASLVRSPDALDALYGPIRLLGLPGASARGLLPRMADRAHGRLGAGEVRRGRSRDDGGVLRHLSLLRAELVDRRVPERGAVQGGLAVARG